MRVQKRSRWLTGLGLVLAAMALWGTQARAQVSSDKPGSVVVWPKVIADGTRDTIITLTNTSNGQAYAHCNYVQGISICSQSNALCTLPNAAPGAPGACPGGAFDVCVQTWQANDFDIALTRQQPTVWRVSTGRRDNPYLPADGRCDLIPGGNPQTADSQSCPGLFIIGNVPTSGVPFRGSLTCVQVNMDGSLVGTDSLKGEATIETLGSTQISTYNSINFEQFTAPNDDIVRLDGVEYAACPEAVELSHYTSGAQDLVAEAIDPAACDPTAGCPVYSEITLVPCAADYVEIDQGPRWSTQGEIVNEFETPTSWSRRLECWANFDLRDPGDFPQYAFLGTTFQRTRFASGGTGYCQGGNLNDTCNSDADCAGGSCIPVPGLLALVEEFHETAASLADPATGPAGTAASNGYSVDLDGDGSFARPGRCRNNLVDECRTDGDCGAGGECLNDELVNLGAGSICVGSNCGQPSPQ